LYMFHLLNKLSSSSPQLCLFLLAHSVLPTVQPTHIQRVGHIRGPRARTRKIAAS
jgi:hypothetical protein